MPSHRRFATIALLLLLCFLATAFCSSQEVAERQTLTQLHNDVLAFEQRTMGKPYTAEDTQALNALAARAVAFLRVDDLRSSQIAATILVKLANMLDQRSQENHFVPTLVEMLRSNEAVIRAEGALGLHYTDKLPPDAIRGIEQALEHEKDPRVVENLIKALARTANYSPHARGVYESKLTSSEPDVRRSTAFAAIHVQDPSETITHSMVSLLRDGDESLQTAAWDFVDQNVDRVAPTVELETEIAIVLLDRAANKWPKIKATNSIAAFKTLDNHEVLADSIKQVLEDDVEDMASKRRLLEVLQKVTPLFLRRSLMPSKRSRLVAR